MLLTILFLSISSKTSWYVGDVIVYLEHKHQKQVYHLAVISVAKRSRLDKFNIPVITLFNESKAKKVIICKVEDIITLAGFVRFNNHRNQFKVIWLDAMYYKKLDNRKRGEISHM